MAEQRDEARALICACSYHFFCFLAVLLYSRRFLAWPLSAHQKVSSGITTHRPASRLSERSWIRFEGGPLAPEWERSDATNGAPGLTKPYERRERHR